MRTLYRSVVGIVIFIFLWFLAALFINESIIIPSPLLTFKVFLDLFSDPQIIEAALHTFWKVLLALCLVLILGILLGLLMGLVDTFYEMSRPIVMVIQAVPVVCWLSLVIFSWGISWQGPIVIAFFSLLPMAILTTVSGVRNLDSKLLEMAKLYQVPAGKVFKDIYMGSLLPFIVAIIDVSVGHAWKVIVVAEYLCGNHGLGVLIAWARQRVDVTEIYALTLLIVLLGLGSEAFIRIILRRISAKWRPA